MVKLQANLELRRHALAVRRGILTAVTAAASGHPGGSLSAVEIMILLYFKRMRIRTAEPGWEDRDRFVLSKGHAAPLLYAVLAQRGFLPVSELTTLRQLGSRLQGHPDMHKVPGVDLSTGSLGQGLSAAIGMALGGRLQNRDFRVYALLGDGELQEGQVWEAAMAAAHHKVHNLTAFIDNNGLQIDGSITEVMSPLPIGEKFAAFGWQVLEVDGHDLDALDEACDLAEAETLRPTAIIARTIKGKGVSFMENQPQWHGAAPNAEQLQVALAELEAAEAELALEESLPGGAQDE
ncbi:MAG: transketolase [Symbiobacteriaceae bacterium]|nr:transketolase [Symbiobacteriaceae bacterium]